MSAPRSTCRSSAPSRRSSRPPLSKTRVIGVLGTEATVRQPYVDDLAAASPPTARHPPRLAELVELAEAKLRGEPSTRRASRRARGRCSTQPGGERIDTIVLACTHFPLLADELAARLSGRRASSTAAPASPAASPG
jgi:glutamate racemase